MRRLSIFLATLALTVATTHAQEQDTLYDLLSENPDLQTAAALTEAAEEDLSAARGNRLPQLRVEGRISRLEEEFTLPVNGVDQTQNQNRDPVAIRATVEQAIYTSGVLSGAINAAKATTAATRASEEATRQNVVLAGATAMSDLVQARGALDVRRKNEAIISQRLEESQSRFDAGLATRTDVLQSESRLAGATAERVLAESVLSSAEEEFTKLFGKEPTAAMALPVLPGALPADLDAAIFQAQKDGPVLEAQRQNAQAATYSVQEARGRSLPQLTLSAEAASATDQNIAQFTGDTESYGVFLNVSMDIFNGGTNRARARAAKSREKAALFQLEQRRREVRQSMTNAWSQRRAALASLEARKRQVQAAQQSRDGVVREAEANRRTRLDVLDAELELANAQVAQLEAERDATVAGFLILALLGRL